MVKRRNAWIRRAAWITLFGVTILATFLGGCVASIQPPENPQDPCKVYLFEDALHAGLILPGGENGYMEYGYGDWDWYALMRNRWYHVFDTLFWPTQGALGRRPLDPEEIRTLEQEGKLTLFQVEEPAARTLMDLLDQRFESERSTRVRNRIYSMDFVHHSESFWLFHNCNDAVASWAELLGCEVSWTLTMLDVDVDRDL